MRLETQLMRGIGPLAVLKLLERGEMYGYEMIQTLEKRTDGVLALGQATLYPMLYNLEAKGYVASRSEVAASGRPRKYYRLTRKGKARLAKDAKQYERMTQALGALGLLPGAGTGGAA